MEALANIYAESSIVCLFTFTWDVLKFAGECKRLTGENEMFTYGRFGQPISDKMFALAGITRAIGGITENVLDSFAVWMEV